MNYTKKVFLFLFFILFNSFTYAQSEKINELNTKVAELNKLYKYEESIHLITDFIHDENATPYDKAHGYLLKSYTYKRVFNYDETLKCLENALREAVKSPRKDELQMLIKAEKSFVYFDTQQYEKAKQYMAEIKDANYAYLKGPKIAMIIMQEGLLYLFEKDFANAEKAFEESLTLMRKFDAVNLPVVYGKMVELYNKMQLPEKRDEAFKMGIESAKKNNILKYQIYMHEVLAGQYEFNKDYSNAYFHVKIIDSLSNIYDADQHNLKLKLYEKQMEMQQNEHKLETGRKTRYFLIILSVALLILFVIYLKLNTSNRQKRILLEKDYERMYNELQFLTHKFKKGETIESKLSQFNLSERHIEIIKRIQQGKTNKEIANELFISENTVKYHLKTIYETLNIDNRNKLFNLLNNWIISKILFPMTN